MELPADIDIVETIHTAKVVIMRKHDDHLLVLWRSFDDDWRPGESDLPGGGLEANETHEEAVCRETLQETGIKIGVATLVQLAEVKRVVQRDHGLVAIHQRLFGTVVRKQDPTFSNEHRGGGWYPADEAEGFIEGRPHKLHSIREFRRRKAAGNLPIAC